MIKLKTNILRNLWFYLLIFILIQIVCYMVFPPSIAFAREDQQESDFPSVGGIEYRKKETKSPKKPILTKSIQDKITESETLVKEDQQKIDLPSSGGIEYIKKETKFTQKPTFVRSIQDKITESDIYLVGPEDILNISVWKNEELNHQVIVRPDGKISFPLIGDVQASGRTPEEIRQEISLKLKEFIPTPTVTVLVERINSVRFYIIGNVPNPGEFVVGRRINVLQALSMAGGLNDFASEKDLIILRTIDGRQIKLPFNYKEIAKGKKTEQNIYLQTGDVIVVP